jgi:hypothetical protein
MTKTGKRVMLTAVVATALVAVGCTSATASDTQSSSAPSTTQATTENEVQELFDGWNDALATLDAEQVADRYAPDAVLLPTVSNEVRTDRAGILDYFEHFLENKPQGTILTSHVERPPGRWTARCRAPVPGGRGRTAPEGPARRSRPGA